MLSDIFKQEKIKMQKQSKIKAHKVNQIKHKIPSKRYEEIDTQDYDEEEDLYNEIEKLRMRENQQSQLGQKLNLIQPQIPQNIIESKKQNIMPNNAQLVSNQIQQNQALINNDENQNLNEDDEDINEIQKVSSDEDVLFKYEFDDEPDQIHSVSRYPSTIKYLYYLSFNYLFQNTQKYAVKLITGNIYQSFYRSKICQQNFNNFDKVPKLINAKPKYFELFFHYINILMGQTYYVCREQMIQNSLIFLRDPEKIEKAILSDSLFTIDQFCPLIAKRDRSQYCLELRKPFTNTRFFNKQAQKYLLIEILDELQASPLLVQVFNNSRAKFLVFKKIQNSWYYFNGNSQIFKISNQKQSNLRSFSENYQHISEQDLVEKYIGDTNKIFKVQQCDQNQMKDQIRIGQIMNQLLNDQNYYQIKRKWEEVFYYTIGAVDLSELQCPTFSAGIFKISDERKNHRKRLLAINTKVYKKQIKKIRKKSQKIARIERSIAMRQARVAPDDLPNEEYDEENNSGSDDSNQEEQKDNYDSDHSNR